MRPAAQTAASGGPDLRGCRIDADLDEMRAEGRLLVLLVEIAVLDRISPVSTPPTAAALSGMARLPGANLALDEGRIVSSKPSFCRTASRSFMQAARRRRWSCWRPLSAEPHETG